FGVSRRIRAGLLLEGLFGLGEIALGVLHEVFLGRLVAEAIELAVDLLVYRAVGVLLRTLAESIGAVVAELTQVPRGQRGGTGGEQHGPGKRGGEKSFLHRTVLPSQAFG